MSFLFYNIVSLIASYNDVKRIDFGSITSFPLQGADNAYLFTFNEFSKRITVGVSENKNISKESFSFVRSYF